MDAGDDNSATHQALLTAWGGFHTRLSKYVYPGQNKNNSESSKPSLDVMVLIACVVLSIAQSPVRSPSLQSQ